MSVSDIFKLPKEIYGVIQFPGVANANDFQLENVKLCCM